MALLGTPAISEALSEALSGFAYEKRELVFRNPDNPPLRLLRDKRVLHQIET
jgi:hypothetical protein